MNTLSPFVWFSPTPLSGLGLAVKPSISPRYQPLFRLPVLDSLGWPNHKQAIVMETIAPEHPGWVKCEGIWWRAMGDQETILYPKTSVTVIGRNGLTLIVEPRKQP